MCENEDANKECRFCMQMLKCLYIIYANGISNIKKMSKSIGNLEEGSSYDFAKGMGRKRQKAVRSYSIRNIFRIESQ